MLNISQKNKQVYILYNSRNFANGLTVTANIYNNVDSLIVGSPFTLSEISTTGLYGCYFTPTTNGNYKIIISEGAITMATGQITIADSDIESIGSGVISISSMLLDAQGTSFNASNDSLHAIRQYLTNTVQTSIQLTVDYLANATYGLAAVKTLIDTYQTANQIDLTNIESKVDSNTSGIVLTNNYLTNPTYGLSALQTAINNISLSTDSSLGSGLLDIKGVGFNTSTDSLKQIKDRTDQIFSKTGGYVL